MYFRHPRDRVNSVERLSCLLALILGTIAINAFFYGSQQFAADLLITVICSLIALPSSILLMFFFRGGSCSSELMTKDEIARGRKRTDRGFCKARGKFVAWSLWLVWCVACSYISLLYGLKFELHPEHIDNGGRFDLQIESVVGKWILSCFLSLAQDFVINRPVIIGIRSLLGHWCSKHCKAC